MRYIPILFLFVIAFALSCGVVNAPSIDTKEDMLVHYNHVKECMDVGDVDTPNVVIVKDAEKVECGDFMRRGCYKSETTTVVLPQHSDTTTIRHEFVHHFLNMTTEDPDNNHTSEYFLKCSGIIVDDDTE